MALFQLPTPPEGINLKDYFESWLPAQLAGVSALLKQAEEEINLAMGFRAEGEGGGDWTLNISKGDITVQSGISPQTLVSIILSAKDLIDVLCGKRTLFPGVARRAKEGETRELKPEKLFKQLKRMAEALKGIQGMVEFKIKGEAGKDFRTRINFGPMKEEPNVSVSINESDFQAMQKGELNPQTAFMSGKIRINGDLSFLLQLAPLMMR